MVRKGLEGLELYLSHTILQTYLTDLDAGS